MHFTYSTTLEDYIECSIWKYWDSETNRKEVNKTKWIMLLGMAVILGLVLWFSSDRTLQGTAIVMFLMVAPSTFIKYEKDLKKSQEKLIRKQVAEGKIPYSGQVELWVNEHGVYSEEKNSILKATYDEIRSVDFTEGSICVFTGHNEFIMIPYRELNRWPEKDALVEVLQTRGRAYRKYYPEPVNVDLHANSSERFYRSNYQALSNGEKERLLRELVQGRSDFEIVSLYRFKAFGQYTDTAVYRHSDGAEFVFVPGDTVTLGWDCFIAGPDHLTQDDMLGVLEKYGITDLTGFVRKSCTPVRQATIGPMLVERQVREIGYQPCSWRELIERTEASGFAVPNEDEWEYLCGGGIRTLWRWGDSFDYGMEIPHFAEKEDLQENAPNGLLKSGQTENHWDIRWPNQFGLVIAFDPYKQEVVSGPNAILKGGDGGENISSGLGVALGFLPAATYYKGTTKGEDSLGYMEEIGGDYTSYRRIIRLG